MVCMAFPSFVNTRALDPSFWISNSRIVTGRLDHLTLDLESCLLGVAWKVNRGTKEALPTAGCHLLF